jgi:excisionase family DNA binding protein
MTNSTPTPVRVSVSEAARLFGVNEKTIRRALARGDIRYVVVHKRYKLLFESILLWSQRAAAVRTKRDRVGIGQWVEQWKIRNTLYSPRPPEQK